MKEIVIISGKGGTGKTTITAALAGLGPQKIIADCDVDAADLHLILKPEVLETYDFISGEIAEIDPEECTQCGECREYCRFGAISEDFTVLQEHCEGCALCYHVCPAEAVRMKPRWCGQWFKSNTRYGPMVHASLGIGEENSGKLVTHVRQVSHEWAEENGYNFIIVDGSPGVGCPVIASLTNTNLALIVCEPTVSAINDLYRVAELTKFFNIQTLAIINKVDINLELTDQIIDFCENNDIKVLGKLGYDPKFTKAQIQAQNIIEYDPDGWGQTMKEIWTKLEEYL